jgi:zinc-ribbon domain
MSDPEIARRCSHCGVSIRQTALYCPQCGEKIGDETVADPVPTSTVHPSHTQHTTGIAGVADNVRERVEKIKHVSSVMIDQASYDPSLRFLLVTALLFVVFLVLLILSKVIG